MSPGHGINQVEADYHVLRRTQRELYMDFDWSNMIINEEVAVPPGAKILPALTKTDYTQINSMWTKQSGRWVELVNGITPNHYSEYNSLADERASPVRNYRYDEAEQGIELWPIPDEDTSVLVRGQMILGPLDEPTDTSTLDATLIVLFAASEIAAGLKKENAAMKQQKAQAYLRGINRNLVSNKKRVISLVNTEVPTARPGLDFIQ
tara:strand:+ start:434 stop:1054 length:621 start_codon:yes stop_codon:yes gene_type:complete